MGNSCSSDEPEESETTTGVASSADDRIKAALGTNSTLLLITVVAYTIMHCKHKQWYYRNHHKRGFGPEPPTSAWGFVPLLLRMPLDEFEQHAGSDARALMETIALGIKVLGAFALFTPIQLTPYLIASYQMYPESEGGLTYVDEDSGLVTDRGDLPRANMALLLVGDVGSHGHAFYAAQWFSVIGLWLLTGLTLRELRRSWQRVVDARERRMAAAAAAPAADPTLHAILVRGTRARPAHEAVALWRGTYGDAVHAVRMVRDCPALAKLVARCFRLADDARALEERIARLRVLPQSERARQMSDTQAEARDAQRARAEARLAAVGAAREAALAEAEAARRALDVPEHDGGCAYFVLFRSLAAVAAARQALHAPATRGAVSAAPPAEEVHWAALHPGAAQRRRVQQLLARAAFVAMLLFYGVPITFVSSLLALESLEARMPWVRTVLCWLGPTVRNLIAAFLPVLALVAFLALLPAICAKLAALHADASRAEAQVRTIEAVWIFQFAWVLFGGPVITGLIEGGDVEQIAVTWASSNSTFLMILLSTKAMFGIPFGGLARVPKIVVNWAKKRLGVQPPNVVRPEPLAYDKAWPEVLLACSAGLLYATIYPPILPFVLAHLCVCYLVYGRGLLFSHSRGWMSGKADGGQGLAWPMASAWLLVALGGAQLLLAALHLANGQLPTCLCCLPLPVLTYQAHAELSKWAAELTLLPMTRYAQIDAERQQRLDWGAFSRPAAAAAPAAAPGAEAPPAAPGSGSTAARDAAAAEGVGVGAAAPLVPYRNGAGGGGAHYPLTTVVAPAPRASTSAAPAPPAASAPPPPPFPADAYVQPELSEETWARLRAGRPKPAVRGEWVKPPPCLRVAVLGPTGGVGRHVTRLALDAGHTVVALAREPSEMVPRRSRRLHTFRFDAHSASAAELAALLKGADFVVSCLGNRRGEPPVVHRGTALLLEAMVPAGVPRMAMLSCVGVGDSAKQLRKTGTMGWLYSLMFATLLSGDRDDLAAAETACLSQPRGGDVACVVVRAADLHDGEGRGEYQVAPAAAALGASVARGDVARFVLSLALDEQHDGLALSVGGGGGAGGGGSGGDGGKAPAAPAPGAAASAENSLSLCVGSASATAGARAPAPARGLIGFTPSAPPSAPAENFSEPDSIPPSGNPELVV